MMKFNSIYAIIFVILMPLASLSGNKEPLVVKRPFLYAVEKNNSVSFLFGSIHVGVGIKNMPNYVKSAVLSREVFATEREIYSAYSTNWPSARIEELPEKVKSAFLKRGMTKKIIATAPIGSLCAIYIQWNLLKDQNFRYMLDAQLQDLATNHSKKFVELDTNLELNKQSFDDFFACDIRQIEQLIEELPPEQADEILMDEYKPFIDEYILGADEASHDEDEEESSFLRNEFWFKKLEKLHEKGFFAVFGISHLGHGHKRGLLGLFNQNGYRVTRIDSEEKFRELEKKYEIKKSKYSDASVGEKK